jgi:hypothetical protein
VCPTFDALFLRGKVGRAGFFAKQLKSAEL